MTVPSQVKSLVWEESKQSAVAHVMGYTYYLAHDFDGWRWFRLIGQQLNGVSTEVFPLMDSARISAQIDCDAQIRAMLVEGQET